MMRRGFPIVLAWAPGAALATGSEAPATPLADLAQAFLALILVLLAILALAWLVRRAGGFGRVENGSFQVLGALSLGARERVVLVRVGGKQLVLGVAPGQVRALCVLEGEDRVPLQAEPDNAAFARRLAALLEGKRS
jgi:flagellar protein FliO/FliZ